jgi:hypothetical protein
MWVFFKLDDSSIVTNFSISQQMWCIVCHFVHQENNGKKSKSKSIQDWKGLIMYNKDHGIVAMNNHAIFNIMMC